MAEPPEKKLKIEQNNKIFLEFRKNEKMLTKLKDAYHTILNGYSEMNVKFLKIMETNARSSESFTRATCTSSSYKEDNAVISFSFGSLFSNGMTALKKYLEDNEVPEEKACQKALKKLFLFLSSLPTSLKQPEKNVPECKWAVHLAQHLFSKLAVDSEFTIDNLYQKKTGVLDTSLSEEWDNGSFGDTSFGCPDAWHGSVDIFLENVAVQVISEKDENLVNISHGSTRGRIPSDYSDYSDESSVELKTSGKMIDSYDQIIAQSIVFSFLQCKQSGTGMGNFLVPSFGVNTSTLVVFFYDCKNDILIQSANLDLFIGDFLNTNMVVCLWLALNYRCFCTGITVEMKQYKANFHNHVGDYLEKYKHEVRRPVVKVANSSKSDDNWAKERGRVSGNPVTIKFVSVETVI